MKKILLTLSLLSTITFSKGLVLSAGAEYNLAKNEKNKIVKFDKEHLALLGLGLEYRFEALRNGRVAFEIAPGAEFKVGASITNYMKFDEAVSLVKEGIGRDLLADGFLKIYGIPTYIYVGGTIKPMVVYNLNDYVSFNAGVKLGVGLFNFSNYTFVKGERGFVNEKYIYIPYAITAGATLGHLDVEFELGARSIPKANLNLFSAGVNLGYKF